MTMYAAAPEVAALAEGMIRDIPEHKPLAQARIEYLFRDKATKSHGRRVLGTASKVGGRTAFLASDEQSTILIEPEAFFVVEVASDTWAQLTEPQRRALVDHELCHLRVGDDGELKLRGHDLEEFAEVVQRHGFWKSDVAHFGSQVAEQLALVIEEGVHFLESLDKPEDDEQ